MITVEQAKRIAEQIQFTPMNGRVLALRLPTERHIGGLYIPETAQKPMNQAIIVKTGTGKKTQYGFVKELPVKVGDRVLFGKYRPDVIKVRGYEEPVLILDSEILYAVVEGNVGQETKGKHLKRRRDTSHL